MRERLTKITIEEVLPYIGILHEKGYYSNKIRHEFAGQSVKVSSLRLHTFVEKGLICADCGVTGAFFALERTNKKYPWNLELYGTDESGAEVLMTKDHITPKSKGGKDHISNTQTMCTHCNLKKGAEV